MASKSASLRPARLAVLAAIRDGHATVNALASELRVTDNAVRLHLTALEADGLIRRRGIVRSGQAGQPAAEYELTSQGGVAMSAAYAPALTALVTALGDKLGARAAKPVFAEAGRRLADSIPSQATGSLGDRAGACAALIESLGGTVSTKAGRGRVEIIGKGCPLASAVCAEPGTCTIIEAMLAQHGGVSVVQKCEHGDRPSCRFEVSLS